eukprot:7796233-Lingulodinium_polyedra.AAC.1
MLLGRRSLAVSAGCAWMLLGCASGAAWVLRGRRLCDARGCCLDAVRMLLGCCVGAAWVLLGRCLGAAC